jgi:hypothetical protein
VDVCTPIHTTADSPLDASQLFAAAVALRQASQQAIARYSDAN